MSMYRRVTKSLSFFFRRSLLPMLATCFLYSSPDLLLGDASISSPKQEEMDAVNVSESEVLIHLEEKSKEKKNTSHHYETPYLLVHSAENEDTLLKWAKQSAEEMKCLFVLASLNSNFYSKFSEEGIKKLSKTCHTLFADKELVEKVYGIPSDRGEDAVAFLVLPMEVSRDDSVIMIHWIVITEQTSPVVLEMINSEGKDLKVFFKELEGMKITKESKEHSNNSTE